jgi:probable HAF family extracellular repeat protein
MHGGHSPADGEHRRKEDTMRYCRCLVILTTALTGLGLAAASAAARPIDWLAPLWLLAPPMAPHYTVTRLSLPPPGLFGGNGERRLNASGQVVGYFHSAAAPSHDHGFLWDNGKLIDLGEDRQPLFINDAGQVAGVQWTQWNPLTPTKEPFTRAFLWENGVLHNLGLPDTGTSEPIGLNNAGQLVVNWEPAVPASHYHGHAFLWEKGVTRDLGTLGEEPTRASAINEAGQVVGTSHLNGPGYHGFLWQRGTMIDLGTLWPSAISNSGLVVGVLKTSSRPDSPGHSVLWENGVMQDLGSLGGRPFGAVEVNDAGQVIGRAEVHQGTTRALLWEKGKITDLGTLGGEGSGPWKMNAAGQVVGTADTSQVDPKRGLLIHAVLWEKGTVTDLNSLLPDGADLPHTIGRAINDRGQILVDGENVRTKERETYLLTPTE